MTGTLGVTHGGTGLTTSTTNALVIGAASNTLTTVTAPTTSGQVLTYNGTSVGWATPSGGGGGISDAPSDGNVYARDNAAWVAIPQPPASSFASGSFSFMVPLNGSGVPTPGATATAIGIVGAPSGWTFNCPSSIMTITHTVGRPPSNIIFWVGTGASSTNPIYVMVAGGKAATGGTVTMPQTGTTALNTTSFQLTIGTSLGTIANGTVYVQVTF